MEYENVFRDWISCPSKTFTENLRFVLKAWKSVEFTLVSKYEILFNLLTVESKYEDLSVDKLLMEQLNELLQLKCRPSLISKTAKTKFISMWLKMADYFTENDSHIICNLLHELLKNEIMQDLFRCEYNLYGQVVGKLLSCYERYLIHSLDCPVFSWKYDFDFFKMIMTTLIEFSRKVAHPNVFRESYNEHMVKGVVHAVIIFKHKKLSFFDQLLEIEKILFQNCTDTAIVERSKQFPVHVTIVILQCAVLLRRGMVQFHSQLLQSYFNFQLINQQEDKALHFTIAAYILEILCEHNINVSFQMTKNVTAIDFLRENILLVVDTFKVDYLKEILQILCGALRLNPLILDNNTFQITTWMMVMNKSTEREQRFFVEYLLLLIEMHRKVGRAEKFVVNILKSLHSFLSINKLCSKRLRSDGKRKLKIYFKCEGTKLKELKGSTTSVEDNFILDLLDQQFYRNNNDMPQQPTNVDMFPHLMSVWPWSSVGVAFTKLIVGLMSKPSLIIWKTLCYNLNDIVAAKQPIFENMENILFQLELISALICQYFIGCRLAEKWEMFWSEVEESRKLMYTVLVNFSEFIFHGEENDRFINCFLQCAFYAKSFDMTLWYYRSDYSIEDTKPYSESCKRIFNSLVNTEWKDVTQRLLNNADVDIKYNLNRLLIQNIVVSKLMDQEFTGTLSRLPDLLSKDERSTAQILFQMPNVLWFVSNLKRKEQVKLMEHLVSIDDVNYEFIQKVYETLPLFELFCLCSIQQLIANFHGDSEKSVLAAIDFTELKKGLYVVDDDFISSVVNAIRVKKYKHSMKNLPKTQLTSMLNIFQRFSPAYCRKQTKDVIMVFHFALYYDLKETKEYELQKMAFTVLADMLKFGETPQIFKYFNWCDIMPLFPVKMNFEFYELIFAAIKCEVKVAKLFYPALIHVLKTAEDSRDKAHLRLLIASMETLHRLMEPLSHSLQKNLDELLAMYGAIVESYFVTHDGTYENHEKFLKGTLPAFKMYAEGKLQHCKHEGTEVDSNFKRICKIYLGFSVRYDNRHAVNLVQMALDQRQCLGFKQHEIDFLLNEYWCQLNDDLKRGIVDENVEAVVQLIVDNKDYSDFECMLRDILKDINEENANYIVQLLTVMSKISFKLIKDMSYIRFLKEVTSLLPFLIRKDDLLQCRDHNIIVRTFACLQIIVANKCIPMTIDIVDNIFLCVTLIDIKNYQIDEDDATSFMSLHLALAEFCIALLKYQPQIIMKRITPYMVICKELLQAIFWYKNEIKANMTISKTEVENLAVLLLKMKELMHIMCTYNLHIKRVAPILLTYILNLIVTNANLAPIQPKLRMIVDEICYDLIKASDHRMGTFILRWGSDATRQVYNVLLQNYKKYHKFNGII